MKKLLILLSFVALAGCATTQGELKDIAAPQYAKVDNENVKISGELITPYTNNQFSGETRYKRHLKISLNDQLTIDGFLTNPKDAQGELSGDFKNHKIVSSCSSSRESRTNLKVDCMILIDNLRTVTLTF